MEDSPQVSKGSIGPVELVADNALVSFVLYLLFHLAHTLILHP